MKIKKGIFNFCEIGECVEFQNNLLDDDVTEITADIIRYMIDSTKHAEYRLFFEQNIKLKTISMVTN